MAVVNFRTDTRSDRALADLTADGSTISGAIRQALIDAVRLRRREQMRQESLEALHDHLRRCTTRRTLPKHARCSTRWMTCVRGDVHRLRAPRGVRGSEQRVVRYAVVVQSDDLLLSTMLVAPTSRSAQPRISRPTIVIENEQTQVLIEQTTAVSPERLDDLVGRVGRSELDQINDALRLALELD